jgi:hypothetical protein
MRQFGGIVMAALAGMAGGCADGNALYSDPKYVPSNKPSAYEYRNYNGIHPGPET